MDEMSFFANGTSYIESLCKSRQMLNDISNSELIKKLDEVIILELELAKMGAEKAKAEILKERNEGNVRPIK